MSYRLVIVDDEEHIREGLSDLVDWSSLGFEVVAKLEDGKEAVEWLQKTEVDIILSDIKMTTMSGLELAKYVHEHHTQTKIVLISGYKEFDFVKQAMSYNVVNYLLKPTKLGDIVSVFQDVKKRLDKEQEDRDRLDKIVKQNNELLPTIRKQLFHDIATGKLNDPHEAENLLKLTEVHANTLNHSCALVKLTITMENTPFYDKNEPFPSDTVEKIIKYENAGILYMPLNKSSESLYILALNLQQEQDSGTFRSTVLLYMQTLVQGIIALLGVEVTAEIVRVFHHLQEMMKERNTYFTVPDELHEQNPTELSIKEKPHLAEQRKQFLTYVHAGNIEALSGQYETLLHAVNQENMPDPFTKNMLIELFSTLCSKLNEMDLPIDKIMNKPFSYETILRLNGNMELLHWGQAILNEIIHYVQKISSTEPTVIQKVKEYIANHFDKDISLEAAASHVYLSPDYLSRVFKQSTGSSFTDYVAEIRIHKSLEYLQDSQYKIYEIGAIVGYKNTKYFFKLFKKYTGYTPSEYKRKSINKEL